mmetsp:Transcript_70650/g.188349  ORF Transcript_70650/g.188349 Transcript_70650/m.188349 type:complete len:241 (+) Transcript_70650:783-1505(+)
MVESRVAWSLVVNSWVSRATSPEVQYPRQSRAARQAAEFRGNWATRPSIANTNLKPDGGRSCLTSTPNPHAIRSAFFSNCWAGKSPTYCSKDKRDCTISGSLASRMHRRKVLTSRRSMNCGHSAASCGLWITNCSSLSKWAQTWGQTTDVISCAEHVALVSISNAITASAIARKSAAYVPQAHPAGDLRGDGTSSTSDPAALQDWGRASCVRMAKYWARDSFGSREILSLNISSNFASWR